jgi:hypothetical protein
VREAGHDLGSDVGLDGGPWLGGSGGGSRKQGREIPWLDGWEDWEVWERGIVGYYFEAEVGQCGGDFTAMGRAYSLQLQRAPPRGIGQRPCRRSCFEVVIGSIIGS